MSKLNRDSLHDFLHTYNRMCTSDICESLCPLKDFGPYTCTKIRGIDHDFIERVFDWGDEHPEINA